MRDRLIAQVRTKIEMDDPIEINRYLGVSHEIKRTKRGKFTDTQYAYNMVDYFKTAFKQFEEETGDKLKLGVMTPSPPEISKEAMDALLEILASMASMPHMFS